MKAGGTGGANTSTGVVWEKLTDIAHHLSDQNDWISVKDDGIYVNDSLRFQKYFKGGFQKSILKPRGLSVKQKSGSKGIAGGLYDSNGNQICSQTPQPDEVWFDVQSETFYCFEKKSQKVGGSTDEKLRTVDYRKKWFDKIARAAGIKFGGESWVLREFFHQPKYDDTISHMRENGAVVMFPEKDEKWLSKVVKFLRLSNDVRSKSSPPSTVIHCELDGEEVCVGEFHYGSAADPKVLEPGKGIKLFLTDPPYNLGFDYGPEVNDRQPEEDYHQMMEDIVDTCYEAADDNAHLFMIHYPQDFAKMWGRLTKKWKFHQWITWAYPANFGHSSKKWTNASRTVLWLVKGDPKFYGERVVQPYRNPTDRRIKKLIHEKGQIGTNLYNWWVVNLCKNVSKDKRDYSNQIPEELLERIILSTTNKGDLVADPFSGTFSTSRTAMRLARKAWGCDLNPEVIKWRPVLSDYNEIPKGIDGDEISEQQLDKKYPFYKIQEAGMTEEQFEKVALHLFENATPEQLAYAPGIGIKKAREFKEALRGAKKVGGTIQTGISSFPTDEN